jgi:CRP-like cAMP-binding protein
MIKFVTTFDKLSPLSAEACEALGECLVTKDFDKGALLLKESQVCKYLYFIDEGLAKTYFSKDGKEFIMRFFPEDALFTVIDSFTTQSVSPYMIMALEKTSVTYISQQDLESLSAKFHCIETAYRRLLSMANVNMMKRVSEMLEEKAGERYNHFLNDNGAILQRISLGDLANYLGITQVSLSRIRAQK